MSKIVAMCKDKKKEAYNLQSFSLKVVILY